MEQFLATGVNGTHLARQGWGTPGSALPLEAAFSLPETGGFLRSDVDDLLEGLPAGLGRETADEDGLNELLPEPAQTGSRTRTRTIQRTRTPHQSRS
jgi:hypothetical protein